MKFSLAAFAGTVALVVISQQLYGRPEFIINFAISWLSDFLSNKTQGTIEKSLCDLGLSGFVDIPAMMKLRMELGGNWQHAEEAHIGEGFRKATGIAYFSPFYIEPHGNHRGYWLLHLAQSSRARSAMTEIIGARRIVPSIMVIWVTRCFRSNPPWIRPSSSRGCLSMRNHRNDVKPLLPTISLG